MAAKEIGLAIVGSGRIGTLRAKLAAGHPAVRFIAVSDADPAKARQLAETVGAKVHSGDNEAIIARPEVNAVIVSTSEGEHVAPILAAIERGLPVLVEKPLALTLGDADRAGAGDREARRQRPRRLQPALQGALPDRQGADPPGPHRDHYRRRRAALQFALAGVCDPQARSARDAGGRRADLLRRPDELVLRGPAHRRGLFARPDRRAETSRPRRAGRQLCGVHL